eukprot:6187977-Pleurochrysis_carterae.AAC.1
MFAARAATQPREATCRPLQAATLSTRSSAVPRKCARIHPSTGGDDRDRISGMRGAVLRAQKPICRCLCARSVRATRPFISL